MSFTRQAEQQQQQLLSRHPCPGCKQPMKLVGRENGAGGKSDMLTFQCGCGQLFETMAL